MHLQESSDLKSVIEGDILLLMEDLPWRVRMGLLWDETKLEDALQLLSDDRSTGQRYRIAEVYIFRSKTLKCRNVDVISLETTPLVCKPPVGCATLPAGPNAASE